MLLGCLGDATLERASVIWPLHCRNMRDIWRGVFILHAERLTE